MIIRIEKRCEVFTVAIKLKSLKVEHFALNFFLLYADYIFLRFVKVVR